MVDKPEIVAADPEAVFVSMLEAHAQASLEASETNSLYSERVLRNAEAVRELLKSKVGEVPSVVGTWFESFKPIAETVFGVDITDGTGMELPVLFGDYSLTVFPGIYGRVRRVLLDEIMGPALSLDLAAK